MLRVYVQKFLVLTKETKCNLVWNDDDDLKITAIIISFNDPYRHARNHSLREPFKLSRSR